MHPHHDHSSNTASVNTASSNTASSNTASSNTAAALVDDDERGVLAELVLAAFANGDDAKGHEAGRTPAAVKVSTIADANRGGGVFSRVLRLELATDDTHRHRVPPSAVAKLPARGANREAAARSGAYRREAHCYRSLLVEDELPTAEAYAVIEHDDGAASLLLQDLTSRRWPEQLSGLESEDARAVVGALARFHHRWDHDIDQPGQRHAGLALVRANTVAGFDHGSLVSGLRAVEQRWANHLSRRQLSALDMMVARHDDVASAFASHRSITLCHGDPRAANLAFARDGSALLIDWQQVARQFGEADVAWLCATSLTPDDRRAFEHDLVDEYGGDVERYRLGLALPAMAVLLLAQRDVDSARAAELITTSLDRIAAAVIDNW
jgi:hypothetical protein